MKTIATGYLAALLVGAAQTGAETVPAEVTFFVSPDGNDAWSGGIPSPSKSGNDGPFATVVRAQIAIRQLRQNGALSSPVTVRIGGIYTLGTQTGSILRNNLIHDIFPYMGKPAMAWGIYLDQGSNGHLIENNIVYNTLTGGVMNTGLPGNTIRNNVFAFSGWHAVWRYRWIREPSSVVERNIFYVTQGELFHQDAGAEDDRSRWDRNLFWPSPLLSAALSLWARRFEFRCAFGTGGRFRP